MIEGQGEYRYDADAKIALTRSLSAERLETYRRAAGFDDAMAFDIYIYNARLAEAFLFPLHIAEITIRNAIDGLLVRLFGDAWPESEPFRKSLREGGVQALAKARERAGPDAPRGQIVATLTFDFWSNMLRAEYDRLIWQKYLIEVFPHAVGRRRDAQDLVREINRFRNRIAHHEPVFGEDVNGIYSRICALVAMRCPITEDWMRRHCTIAEVVRLRPRRRAQRTSAPQP